MFRNQNVDSHILINTLIFHLCPGALAAVTVSMGGTGMRPTFSLAHPLSHSPVVAPDFTGPGACREQDHSHARAPTLINWF